MQQNQTQSAWVSPLFFLSSHRKPNNCIYTITAFGRNGYEHRSGWKVCWLHYLRYLSVLKRQWNSCGWERESIYACRWASGIWLTACLPFSLPCQLEVMPTVTPVLCWKCRQGPASFLSYPSLSLSWPVGVASKVQWGSFIVQYIRRGDRWPRRQTS